MELHAGGLGLQKDVSRIQQDLKNELRISNESLVNKIDLRKTIAAEQQVRLCCPGATSSNEMTALVSHVVVMTTAAGKEMCNDSPIRRRAQTK